jgi:hypothetical protein
MFMAERDTLVDSLLKKIKNNRVVAVIIVAAAAVSAVAVFTDKISKIPDAVGKIRSFVLGSPQTETERKLVLEVTHRANEALKELQRDEEDLKFENKQYPPEDIYYNVTRYLNNSFPSTEKTLRTIPFLMNTAHRIFRR